MDTELPAAMDADAAATLDTDLPATQSGVAADTKSRIGRYRLERILGEHLPDPPADVPRSGQALIRVLNAFVEEGANRQMSK